MQSNYPIFPQFEVEPPRPQDGGQMLIEPEESLLQEACQLQPELYFEEKPPNMRFQTPLIPANEIQAIENLRTFLDQSLSTASSIVSSERSAEEAKSASNQKQKRKRKTTKKGGNNKKNARKFPQHREAAESGCKCKRSKCKKGFCECIEHGVACGETCGCSGCGNKGKEREHGSEKKGRPEREESDLILFKKVKME